jgi:hypothetical protein
MSPLPEILQLVNSTSAPDRPVRRVRGQYLARAHLSRKQRAEIAADLVEGRAEIAPLTVRQAATLAAVPVVEVSKVRRTNGNGHGNGKPKHNGETLAEHIARSSPAERIAAARAIGVSLIWDTMIDPVITAEQTAAE